MLIAMYAVQMQILTQILVQVTMDHARYWRHHVRDYDALRPHFVWLPTDIIKRTFEVTTQYAPMPLNTILRKRFKSPNPLVNVPRRDEPVSMDTIQSDVPAIDGGEKYAQIFVGTKSLVTDVHGMKSPAQFPGILTDEIITHGAPTKLISDSACVETSKEVHSILHTYGISSWQSEPHQQLLDLIGYTSAVRVLVPSKS
jgi:hypothetical protein